MEQRRLYPDMTAEEQLKWVTDFEALMQDGGGRIIDMARRRQPQWQPEDALTVRRLVGMLAAWPFAQDFAEKAQRYGDYMARATRLPVYVDKVMERLADGLTMTDKDGRTVAYVSPSAPLRRRGRPSREELAARQRGEQPQGAEPDDAEARRRRTVARMLGLDVIVSGSAPREKNNAELKAERDRRRAEYERQNPSLFGGASGTGTCVSSADASARQEPVPSAARESMGTGSLQQSNATASGAQVPVPSESHQPSDINHQTSEVSPCAQLMSDSYEMRMAQDKLHLDQLAWLLSKPLQDRVRQVQSQRTASEAASERAKLLAEMGGSQTEIAEYAEQAKVSTEAYLATYAAVDEELAVLHKRLYLDTIYLENFKRRFKGVDIEKVLHITRPYYEKVKKDDPAIDARVKLAIETDNPEYAAKLKAKEDRKQELQALHRYIMRTDKPASDERVKTMTERIERVRALAGDETADAYLPVLEKTKADNIAWHAAKEAKKGAKGSGTSAPSGAAESSGTGSADSSEATASEDQVPVPSDSPAPKERKKPASKKPKTKTK